MATSTINIRIPLITSLETAIRLYYERDELTNSDIRELFGVIGHTTVSKLKKKAWELMQERNTPVWNASRVNTEVAYEAWGLNIAKLEHRWEKLKKLEVKS